MTQKWESDLSGYFPKALRAALRLAPAQAARLEEIRVRIGRPLQLLGNGFDVLCGPAVAAEALAALAEALCEHSPYAFARERNQGYFTLRGGYRVGLCGRMGTVGNMGETTGLNLRIAREWRGCADALTPQLWENGAPVSALLLSPPGVGKTTMLRDVARQLSDGVCGPPQKVAVADERSEIAGGYLGVPTLDVGARTDVMDGYPKAVALRMLLRSMSPTVIVTDEIGDAADARAIREASRAGVAVIASAHARDEADAAARGDLREIMESGVFSRIVVLRRERGAVCCRIA